MQNLLEKKDEFIKLGSATILAVFLSMVVHEFGHYLAGTLLGNYMMMDLNGSRPVSGGFLQPWHSPIVTSGGPVFTLLQTLAALVLILIFKKKWLYPLVLVPGMIRIGLYTSVIAFPKRLLLQDEAKLGDYLGLNVWAIPLVVCILLITMIWLGNRELKLSWKYNVSITITGYLIFMMLLKINQIIFY